jgi:hypothetical protein
LRKLIDVFKEITLTITSDDYYAYNTIRNKLGVLEQVKVAQLRGERNLSFLLTKDTNISINENVIMNEFKKNTPPEETTLIVADIIKSEWLKLICK